MADATTILAFTIAGGYLGLLLVKTFLAWRYTSFIRGADPIPLAPDSVTLVTAILSGDPLLESRLRMTLDALPEQRFIWLIDDDDDEAQAIAAAAAAANERLQVVSCPACPEHLNPKTWKLERATSLIVTHCVMVLDDDTVVTSSAVAALVNAAGKASVATGLPLYEPGPDLGSGLLAEFVNNNAIFTYLGTAALRPPFTLNGMGYVITKANLKRLGGYTPILPELTDDLAMAELVLKNNGSIHQDSACLHVRTTVEDIAHYARLMHRWYIFTILLLRKQSVPLQALIALLHGLPPFLLLTLCVVVGFSGPFVVAGSLLAVTLAVRTILLAGIQRGVFGRVLHRPVYSVVSELLQPLHLLHAACYRTIRWRSRRYRIESGNSFRST